MEPPALVAVSHGTADPDGAAAIAALVTAIARALPQVPVAAAHVDLVPPTPAQVLATLPGHLARVVVPLMLSVGPQLHTELDRTARAHGAVLTPPLGSDPRLTAVLARRLREAGLQDGERVLLVTAGSGDPDAGTTGAEHRALLAAALGRPVAAASLTTGHPRAADEATLLARRGARVAVAPCLLTSGAFQRMAEAVPAARIARPLLLPDDVPPELVAIVADRYRSALR